MCASLFLSPFVPANLVSPNRSVLIYFGIILLYLILHVVLRIFLAEGDGESTPKVERTGIQGG